MEIDPIDMTVTTVTDIRLETLESRLREEGYTLGFAAPGAQRLSLRQLLERAVPNRLAGRYGEWPQICVALTVVKGRRKVVETKAVPRSAAGPDLKRALLGSQGTYGKIQQAVLRFHHHPKVVVTPACVFPRALLLQEFITALDGSGVMAALVMTVPEGKLPASLRAVGKHVAWVWLEGRDDVVSIGQEALKSLVERYQGRLVLRKTAAWKRTVQRFLLQGGDS